LFMKKTIKGESLEGQVGVPGDLHPVSKKKQELGRSAPLQAKVYGNRHEGQENERFEGKKEGK